ncbi:MAG: hypothetical protein C4334_04095 [Pyrinomonas sp.]|uniref:site-2 protease family protein n=1 Tax=Pyrinomonas sp. TaxID=2080306 RepID=UPI003328AEE5
MGELNIGLFILYMIALIFSLSAHEAAHAWMSNRFGDDLARSLGRVTLNPTSHVDPVGTLLFPALAFFTNAPLLGWARPTPINPANWSNYRVANFFVSIAGILANALIAVVAGITLRLLLEMGMIAFGGGWFVPTATDSAIARGAVELLVVLFVLNVTLAIFNLLPIPPLDGSKILSSLLPERFGQALGALDQIGFILLFVAVFTGVFGVIFRFVMPIAWSLLLLGYN